MDYYTKIGLNHYDLNNIENYNYFERCIIRFNKIMDNQIDETVFLYMNPLISNETLSQTIDKCNIFTDYLKTKNSNFVVVYFILLHTNNEAITYNIHENITNKIIVIINCNKNFIDYGFLYNDYPKIINIVKEVVDNNNFIFNE